MPFKLFLAIGLFFGAVAAVMAFLIIYDEYRKHRLSSVRLWKEALSGAAVTFVVFVFLALIVGVWALHLVG